MNTSTLDNAIIESEKSAATLRRWLYILFSSCALLCGCAWFAGCAALDEKINRYFDANGDLTAQGQVVMGAAKGAVESVQSITPQPWSGIIGGVAGGAALLVLGGGKLYRAIRPKEETSKA